MSVAKAHSRIAKSADLFIAVRGKYIEKCKKNTVSSCMTGPLLRHPARPGLLEIATKIICVRCACVCHHHVLRRAVYTCVRWLVTLCDPTWQVTSHGSEMEFHYSSTLLQS